MRTPDQVHHLHTVDALRARRGPYDHLTLRLTGLTALYGLNGAGKSWALQAINECGSGLVDRMGARDYSQLFVHAPAGSLLYQWAMVYAAHGDEEAWDQVLGGESDLPTRHLSGTPLDAVRQFFLDQRAASLPPGYNSDRAEDLLYDHASYFEEVAGSTTLAFVPVGRRRREWEVWICASPYSSAGPAVRQEIEKVRDAHDAATAALDAFYEEHPDDIDDDVDAEREDALVQAAGQMGSHPLFAWGWHHQQPRTSSDSYFLETSPVVAFLRDGLPIPAARLFVARDYVPLNVLYEADPHALGPSTARALKAALKAARAGEDEDDVVKEGNEQGQIDPDDDADRHLRSVFGVVEPWDSWARATQRSANDIYGRLLQDAPPLRLTVRPFLDWLDDAPCTWTVDGIDVENLSRAESRWARFAVHWAVEGAPDLVTIDEPEAALHRSAEEHIAAGLDALTISGARFVVATHSPLLLDSAAASLYEVSRAKTAAGSERGPAQVRPLTGPGRSDLARLGLRPSDLLRRIRVFVLVEGEHDRVVLERTCGELLREARAHLIPIRGGGQLPITLESQFLFEFTDAHIVAVLDNLDVDNVRSAWQHAQELVPAHSHDAAVKFLRGYWKQQQWSGEEYAWLLSWLTRALRAGRPGRLTPLGLGARDIIEYLRVPDLVPNYNGSWADLRLEHDVLAVDLPKSDQKKKFKDWLRITYGADLSVASVERAAAALSPAPRELTSLGYQIRMTALGTPLTGD